MAFAETAPLIAQLDLKGNFAPNLKKAQGALSGFASRLDTTSARFERAGRQIGQGFRNIGKIAVVGVAALATQVAAGLHSLIELEKQTAQTEAVIKSTGGAAGVTAAEVGRLSEKFESLNATVGDEFIRAGANMLLTFTNIRGKAFEPALEAVLNMNTAMGKGPEGLTATAIQLGKALNDPATGLTTLRRVGVTFDAQQIKRIKNLQKEGKLYEAQQVILAELNKEFGNSFAAQGDTTAGKVAKFTDAIGDLQRALAEALLPTLGNVADALTKTLQNESVIQGVKDFGKSLANLISPANLAEGGRIISDVFTAAKAAAPTIAAAAQTMGTVLSTAVSIFRSLPKEIQALAIGGLAVQKLTGGLVTNVIGGLGGEIFKQFAGRGSSPANPVYVSGVGLGGTDILGGGKGLLGKALSLISKVFVVTLVAELATQLKNPLDDIATSLHKNLIGDDNPLSDFGEAFNNWRQNADWPFGQKNAPDWAYLGGNKPPPPPTNVSPDWFDKLKQEPVALPVRPVVIDSPRTAPANLKDLEAILARGRAAGFKPTLAAAQATNQKNLERLAAAQLAEAKNTTSAVRAGDTRAELAGIRSAVASQSRQVPVTNVAVNVNVTAAQVSKSVVIQRRFGPPGGSRVRGGGELPGV